MILNNSYQFTGNTLGLKRGMVKSLEDPLKLNRIQVTLVDENIDLPFAGIVSLFATKEIGTVFVPQVGDEVLAGFIDGQINNPIILGSVYNSENTPPLIIDNKKNAIMYVKFHAGLEISIDNTEDKQKVIILTKKGHSINLDDGENETVEIKEKENKTSFKIDFKNGQIDLKASKLISLMAGEDELTIESQKGVNIKSSGGDFNVAVNAASIETKSNFDCKASSKFSAAGEAGIELSSSSKAVMKGTAGAEFSSTAQTVVKGVAGVELSSTGQTVVKGAITQIN